MQLFYICLSSLQYLFSTEFGPRNSSLPFWLAEPVLVATVEELSAELVLVAAVADMKAESVLVAKVAVVFVVSVLAVVAEL